VTSRPGLYDGIGGDIAGAAFGIAALGGQYAHRTL
jgi:hypothetical protein